MSALSRDTHPSADDMQVQLLRQATVARRFALVRSLSASVIGASRRALKRRHPEASDREIGLLFVELHYGADLANRVRRYLEERGA